MQNNKIDKDKLRLMILKIFGKERENTKTKEYSNREMKQIIKEIIEEGAK